MNKNLLPVAKLSGIILLLILFGCDSSSNKNGTSPVAYKLLKLSPAENCDDLKTYITESLIKQYASIPRYIKYYYCPGTAASGGGSVVGDGSAPAPAAGGEASAGNKAVPDDVSDTNNQEAGVNEADIIKVDPAGNIFLVSGRHFIVAKGFPPTEMTELARIDLGGRGLNLFLDRDNHRVTVLARQDDAFYVTAAEPTAADEALSIIYPKPESDFTVALFFDVSTPAQPVLIEQLHLQGYYREGRRIKDRIHLVSNHQLRPMNLFNDPDFPAAYYAFDDAVRQAHCNNPDGDVETDPVVIETRNTLVGIIEGIVSATDIQQILPDAYQVTDGKRNALPYLACTDVNYPEINLSLGLQVISSVNTDGANLEATSIVNNSYITYVSQENLYLAETSRNWWWQQPNGTWPKSQTAIYKFAISGDKPEYMATGRVDGWVQNQFSFSEYNSYLRVATTQNDVVIEGDIWRQELSNNVFVLSENTSGELNVTGEVRGFGENETIRSSRFYGDKGFVVTFRNIDPLFTFDLSDSVHPSLEGELEMPGFSTYIHQYDDNHLLTIGRSGGTGGMGMGNGLRLQLIDVSDLKNPQLVHFYEPSMGDGWQWSSAEYDHKAFTFYKPANLLAIPIQIYPSISADYFSGVIAYDVSVDTGFNETGRVDHKDLSYEYYCSTNTEFKDAFVNYCSDGMYMQWASPRRSIVMTGNDQVYLYTMSDVGLKGGSTTDLSNTLGQLIFPIQPYPWWRYLSYPVGVVDPLPMVEPGASNLAVF